MDSARSSLVTKLHLGAGNEILPGWVNHDLAPLPGIASVHDLSHHPWPWPADSFEEVRMIDVLEHLPAIIPALEELHRVCRPGAAVTIRVPYWNSIDMATDPTHKLFFSEYTFDYFDPEKHYCQSRPYYSTARFRIARKFYHIRLPLIYKLKIARTCSPLACRIASMLAQYIGGVINAIEVELIAIK